MPARPLACENSGGMRIVLCYPVEPRHVSEIAAVAPAADIVDAGQEHVGAELPTADIFCGHPKVPVPWDRVVADGRLKWIQSSAAGLDHCLVPVVVHSPIIVTSASGVLADQVSEHAVGLAIASRSRDLFGMLVCVGLAALIGAQTIINLSVVGGLMPNKGLVLPFMSYGGTALVTLFTGIGILMSIHSHRMLVKK